MAATKSSYVVGISDTHGWGTRPTLSKLSIFIIPQYLHIKIKTVWARSPPQPYHSGPFSVQSVPSSMSRCISLTVKRLCEVLRLVHLLCLVQVNVSQECRPGQKSLDQRYLWATSSNQPPTGLTEWNYRDGWLVINCCFKIGIKSRQGHTILEFTL